MDSKQSNITQILNELSAGNKTRIDQIIPLVHNELHRLAERAGRFADVCPEHVAARSADRLVAKHSRCPFGRTVERRDLPVRVHREDAVGDAIQDNPAYRAKVAGRR